MTDSAYMGSESTYSECETFTDEDTSTLVHPEMHDEVETDSAIDSTVHSEFTDPIEEQENGSVFLHVGGSVHREGIGTRFWVQESGFLAGGRIQGKGIVSSSLFFHHCDAFLAS